MDEWNGKGPQSHEEGGSKIPSSLSLASHPESLDEQMLKELNPTTAYQPENLGIGPPTDGLTEVQPQTVVSDSNTRNSRQARESKTGESVSSALLDNRSKISHSIHPHSNQGQLNENEDDTETPATLQNDVERQQKPRSGSMAAVMQGRQPDPIPGSPIADNGGSGSFVGEPRLRKDSYTEVGKARNVAESTDEDVPFFSSEEETNGLSMRGRQRNRRKKGESGSREQNVSTIDTNPGSKKAGQATASKKAVPKKLKTFEPLREKQERAKAGLDSSVTVAAPGGEKSVKRSLVHPNTNYDRAGSRGVSPTASDSEEMKNIKRAQRLAINAFPIDNITPHRVIRNILRGNFRGIQQEAKTGKRRLRKYLVATDISDEAAYALEWTIGTVLRDGDTLLAIYAVNEETGTGKTGDPERLDDLELTEGAKAMQETTAIMEKMTADTQQDPSVPHTPSSLSAVNLSSKARRDSDRGSKDSRLRSKAESERLHAIDSISETCIRFLRKTNLQVRITIEVIMCKSPKHLITEAIDALEPTLVVLGSRGRGSLKGVLLGSFSNYLVTKSSVPVMVARKRLSGRKAKNVSPNIRLANNLTPTNRLALAKID
ncbi:MAG: hypothetical protein LQ342_003206 [Letrouitia transgressa]|nr:MAG: hypothetical protein LQ342_003206 [Letrouitia transgressa]